MAGLIQRKIAAASLLEVVVSMVVITMVFSLAMAIYFKVTISGPSVSKEILRQNFNRIFEETRAGRNFNDESIIIDSVTYTKTFTAIDTLTDVFRLNIRAETNGVILDSAKHIFLVDDPHQEN